MTFPAFKRNVFILEGLNGFAGSIYFNYLFFYLKDQFGFSNSGNLLFGAINGLVYTFGALYGGKFAQRKGYLTALQTGWVLIIGAMLAAAVSKSIVLHLAVMIIWSVGISFTWPALEALSCEGENGVTLPRKVGIYNVVWSLTLAFAYFVGGAIIERFGWASMFLIPAAIHLIQIVLTRMLPRTRGAWHELADAPALDAEPPHELHSARAKRFLRMAWLTNPFAYIAMNTIVPLIPDVAARLHLSPTGAGFFCSIWTFARMGCFALLWKWTGWHYRFRWLLASYLLMIACFAAILLFSRFWLLVLAQLGFGLAVGLIYYSSLYYSMDSSDTKGEHGGLHEAAIGAGIFGGPAIGVTAIYFFPTVANVSVLAVSAFLMLGLGGLLRLGSAKIR